MRHRLPFLLLALVPAALSVQTFRDVSKNAGFARGHVISSCSAVWTDYDDDGDLDVLTVGHLGPKTGSITQLWRQDGGRFTDVTVEAGLAHDNGDCHGPVWADFDNDGDADLFIAKGSPKTHPYSLKNYNELWRNNGDGTFDDVAEPAGVIGIGHRGRSASAIDFDRDGLLDIYVLSWRIAEVNLGNALFRQDRAFSFSDVAEKVGLLRLGEATHSRRYAAPGNRVGAWADYNRDGLPDVMIMQPLALFVNRGDGIFADVTEEAGVAPVPYAGSATWGDYDNDGWLDVYVSIQKRRRGILYHNDGDGTFSNVTRASGLRFRREAWAAVWGDYDNDGYLDLYVVSAFNRQDPNRLYRNQGDGTFVDVTEATRVKAQVRGKGIDASFVDYNGDGFLDIFITNGSGAKVGPYVLLESSGNANHWLDLQLVGRASNRDGVMTRVVAKTRLGVQYREHNGPAHHLGQSRTPLHLGLGAATEVESLELVWPSGVRQRLEHLGVDQSLRVVEPSL